MIITFRIIYKGQSILVEGGATFAYVLKYPDGKYLMLDRNVGGWIVEDKSGDHWTAEDIKSIGALIWQNEPDLIKEELK